LTPPEEGADPKKELRCPCERTLEEGLAVGEGKLITDLPLPFPLPLLLALL